MKEPSREWTSQPASAFRYRSSHAGSPSRYRQLSAEVGVLSSRETSFFFSFYSFCPSPPSASPHSASITTRAFG